jgi:Multimeric flavodoxin WrbA
MSKKVLILSGSPRKGGNSDILCDEFLRGAQDAGHKAEKIRVAEEKGGSLFRLLLLQHPRRSLRPQG